MLWRAHNPDKFSFTWMRKNPTHVMSRLDYFLTSENLAAWAEKVYISPGFKMDHSLIGKVIVKYSFHMFADRTMLYSLLPNCLIMS